MKLDDKGNVNIDIKRYHELLQKEEQWNKLLSEKPTHTVFMADRSSFYNRREVGIITNDEAVKQLADKMVVNEEGFKKDLISVRDSHEKNNEFYRKQVRELKDKLKQDALRIYRYSPVWDFLQLSKKIEGRKARWNKDEILVDKKSLQILHAKADRLMEKVV